MMGIKKRLEYLRRLVIEASKLDIFDLAYEFSSEELNSLSLGGYWEKTNGFPRRGIAIRIGIFFWHFCKSLIDCMNRRSTAIPQGSIVFFAISKNEIDSLKPVYTKISRACLTGGYNTTYPFPFLWAYVVSCPFFPSVMICFLKASGYKKKSFSYVFDHYWLIYGMYIVARMWLRLIRPVGIVLANQLYPYHRVIMKAARDEGIVTFYMQHATTPDRQSSMAPMYDIGLLEGRDGLKQIASSDQVRARVYLVGMPKYDIYSNRINMEEQVKTIGICTNNPDPLLRAEQIIVEIYQNFPKLTIILRPHNSDLRFKKWRNLAKKYDIEFSDPKEELSFDFLSRVDLIIAGDSNILLEAALMNVVPVYYDYPNTYLDWYGFHRNHLVGYFSESYQIIDFINEIRLAKPFVRANTKFYCATVGTSYDGHSGELAAALIQSLVSSTQVNRSIWKRTPDIGLEAYGLDEDGQLFPMERNL